MEDFESDSGIDNGFNDAKDKFSRTEFIGSGPEFDLLHQFACLLAKQGELQGKQVELLDDLMSVLAKGQELDRGNHDSLT